MPHPSGELRTQPVDCQASAFSLYALSLDSSLTSLLSPSVSLRMFARLSFSLSPSLSLSLFLWNGIAVCSSPGHNKVQLLLQAPPGTGLGVMLTEHHGTVRSTLNYSSWPPPVGLFWSTATDHVAQ